MPILASLSWRVKLDWTPDEVHRLIKEARQQRRFRAAIRASAEIWNGTATAEEAAKRQAREAAGQGIRELRKGNILGPDLTARDLLEAGRHF